MKAMFGASLGIPPSLLEQFALQVEQSWVQFSLMIKGFLSYILIFIVSVLIFQKYRTGRFRRRQSAASASRKTSTILSVS